MSVADDRNESIYGVYHVGNREFIVKQSKTDECGNTLPRFPLFEPAEYDEAGRPYVFACKEGCEHFDSGGAESGASLCCDCIYLKGDPIGLCMCEARRTPPSEGQKQKENEK